MRARTTRNSRYVSAVTGTRSERMCTRKQSQRQRQSADDQGRSAEPCAACPAGYKLAGYAGSCRLFIVKAFVTMSCVRCTKDFTATIGETCVTVARPPARRRGGGTPDDRARKSHGAATPAGRRAARDQGEQGQERGYRRCGAEVVAVEDQPLRAGQDGPAAAGGRAAARLLRDHRAPPCAVARARRGRGAERLVGGTRR